MEMPAYLELQNKDFIVNHVTILIHSLFSVFTVIKYSLYYKNMYSKRIIDLTHSSYLKYD